MNSDTGGFTFESDGQKFTAPGPSQSVWDTLLAVLVGAAIAIAAGMAQANAGRWNND